MIYDEDPLRRRPRESTARRLRHERCVWMARETTKWPSTRWPITKIMSSDGCNGNRVPLEMGPWYDFREFGCHLGNVGFNPSWVKMSQKPSLVQSAQSVPGALTPDTAKTSDRMRAKAPSRADCSRARMRTIATTGRSRVSKTESARSQPRTTGHESRSKVATWLQPSVKAASVRRSRQ